MNTTLKVFFVFLCVICLWNLSPLPEMIVVTQNSSELQDTFVVSGFVIPTVILITLGVLALLFSLLGIVLVTMFIVVITFLIVGLSFSWPLLFAGILLYWMFKQPNSQKA